MSFLKSQITQFLTATIFSIALMLPAAVQFAHSFEGHKHEVCTDVSSHIHEKQLDCSIFDFHFSIFNFNPQELPEVVTIHSFQNTETLYILPKIEGEYAAYYLRGPPLHS